MSQLVSTGIESKLHETKVKTNSLQGRLVRSRGAMYALVPRTLPLTFVLKPGEERVHAKEVHEGKCMTCGRLAAHVAAPDMGAMPCVQVSCALPSALAPPSSSASGTLGKQALLDYTFAGTTCIACVYADRQVKNQCIQLKRTGPVTATGAN